MQTLLAWLSKASCHEWTNWRYVLRLWAMGGERGRSICMWTTLLTSWSLPLSRSVDVLRRPTASVFRSYKLQPASSTHSNQQGSNQATTTDWLLSQLRGLKPKQPQDHHHHAHKVSHGSLVFVIHDVTPKRQKHLLRANFPSTSHLVFYRVFLLIKPMAIVLIQPTLFFFFLLFQERKMTRWNELTYMIQ